MSVGLPFYVISQSSYKHELSEVMGAVRRDRLADEVIESAESG